MQELPKAYILVFYFVAGIMTPKGPFFEIRKS